MFDSENDKRGIETKELVKTLTGHLKEIHSLAIRPQEDILATADFTEIRLWDLKTGELLEVLSGCAPVVFSNNGDLLVSSTKENNIIIWRQESQFIFNYEIDSSRKWWEILGVTEDSCFNEVKRAYHLLAKIYHPDLNKSSEAIKNMQTINYAYEKFLAQK